MPDAPGQVLQSRQRDFAAAGDAGDLCEQFAVGRDQPGFDRIRIDREPGGLLAGLPEVVTQDRFIFSLGFGRQEGGVGQFPFVVLLGAGRHQGERLPFGRPDHNFWLILSGGDIFGANQEADAFAQTVAVTLGAE